MYVLCVIYGLFLGCVIFMLFVCYVAWLFLLGCQYQCKWLTGKTRLVSEMTYDVLMGTLNPTHSLTHSLWWLMTSLSAVCSDTSSVFNDGVAICRVAWRAFSQWWRRSTFNQRNWIGVLLSRIYISHWWWWEGHQVKFAVVHLKRPR